MTASLVRVGRSATGLGLFATKPIKRGGYIATYRGRRGNLEPLGVIPSAMRGRAFAEFQSNELVKWGKAVLDSGATVE